MVYQQQLFREIHKSCDACILKHSCSGQPCSQCASQSKICTYSPNASSRLRTSTLRTETFPKFFPLQGSLYNDSIDLYTKVNIPYSDTSKRIKEIGLLDPDEGYDDEFLKSLLFYSSSYFTTRFRSDEPPLVEKGKKKSLKQDFRFDMFYSCDGTALVGLEILVQEYIRKLVLGDEYGLEILEVGAARNVQVVDIDCKVKRSVVHERSYWNR